MLTDIQCRSAQPKERDYKLTDGGGLFLLVKTSGFKSWRMKYRFAGKEKLLTFGAYPLLKLTEARKRREDAKRQLLDGIDPAVAKKGAGARQADNARHFETIAREWHAMQRDVWSPTHARDVLDSLMTHVFPVIGKQDLAEVPSAKVLEIVRAIEARPAIETARRVRQRISAVYVYAIALGLAANDPAAPIAGAMKPLIKGRQPAFTSLEEARALLVATEASPAHPLTKLASRFLALTAVRPGVLRSLPWAELEQLDGGEPLWRIPASRMKLVVERKQGDRYDFLVPLAAQAVDVLNAARSLSGRGPLVFPNGRHAHRPMSENAIGYFYNRISQFRGRHVPHGWRSTFSTVMNEHAQARDRPADRAIIDLMLAHLPSNVEGIYNRAAYLPRRRALAQEWADMLLADMPPAASLIEGPRR